MHRDEAIEKVRKLLALSNGTTEPAEAASAAARAQAIMDAYRIESAMLDQVDDEPDETIENFAARPDGQLDTESGGKITSWLSYLAQYVSKANACEIYHTRRRVPVEGWPPTKTIHTTELVGRPSDAETVRYLYAYLKRECAALVDRHGRGLGRTWRNNFLIGCTDTIRQKLAAMRKATQDNARQDASNRAAIRAASTGQDETTAQSTALVRIDQALAKVEQRHADVKQFVARTMRLRKGQGSAAAYNGSARSAGQSAAQSIHIGSARGSLGSGARQISGGR